MKFQEIGRKIDDRVAEQRGKARIIGAILAGRPAMYRISVRNSRVRADDPITNWGSSFYACSFETDTVTRLRDLAAHYWGENHAEYCGCNDPRSGRCERPRPEILDG